MTETQLQKAKFALWEILKDIKFSHKIDSLRISTDQKELVKAVGQLLRVMPGYNFKPEEKEQKIGPVHMSDILIKTGKNKEEERVKFVRELNQDPERLLRLLMYRGGQVR